MYINDHIVLKLLIVIMDVVVYFHSLQCSSLQYGNESQANTCALDWTGTLYIHEATPPLHNGCCLVAAA